MKRTYQNFIKLSNLFPNSETACIEDAVMEYQETSDPMMSNICVAFVYCKMFRFMLWRSKSYFNLTEEDKSSYCLEELTKMMSDFDPRMGATPHTLLDRYLSNRFRTETESLSYAKRKSNNNTESYDVVIDMNASYEESEYDDVDFLTSLSRMDLTSNELRYCELIVRNSDKILDTDIAGILGVSSSAITQIKKRLQTKLSLCIAI